MLQRNEIQNIISQNKLRIALTNTNETCYAISLPRTRPYREESCLENTQEWFPCHVTIRGVNIRFAVLKIKMAFTLNTIIRSVVQHSITQKDSKKDATPNE